MGIVGDWTKERIDLLKKLWADGFSAAQVAKELGGITRSAVIGKVHRLSLPERKKGPALGSRQTKPRQRATREMMQVRRLKAKESQPPHFVVEELVVERRTKNDDAIPFEQRCSIFDLTNQTCRWPIGIPGEPEFFFCGALGADNPMTPYCRHHRSVAFQPPSRRPFIPQRRVAA